MLTNRTEMTNERGDRRTTRTGLLAIGLVVAIVLLACTGCSGPLFGDNKVAYDRMVKAADYFKYPSSVQIVSGEVSGDRLYCQIRAKNGFGNYSYGTYTISTSGYPLESSSRSCLSSELDCTAINKKLADHFGVPYTE